MPKHLCHREKPSQSISKAKALKKLDPAVRKAMKAKVLAGKHNAPGKTGLVAPAPVPKLAAEPPPPAIEKIVVGRALILAHGAGGSSSHSSMKMWKQRLSHLCDGIFMVDFPKTSTAARARAYADAVSAAHAAGHRRLVLVGVGMGARVAFHLLSGVAGEDGETAEPLSPSLRECVVGVVSLGLPLMQKGTTTPRDAALRGLPADAPPLLLVSGSNDPSAGLDRASDALADARAACACSTSLHVVEGGDQHLRVAPGTYLEKETTAALEAALGTFVNGALGPAEVWSNEKYSWVGGARPVKKAKASVQQESSSRDDDAPAALAAPAASAASAERSVVATGLAKASAAAAATGDASLSSSLTELQKANWEAQRELKQLSKQAAREEQEAHRLAKEAARAETEKKAAEKEKALDASAVAPREIVLSGCGSAEVNGTYRIDGTRDGVPSYRIVRESSGGEGEGSGGSAAGGGPSFTIERDSAPDQATQWCLCVDFGFVTWCFVDSDTDAPPATGWQVSEEACTGQVCTAPAPSLTAAPGSETELPPEPEFDEEGSEDEGEMEEDEYAVGYGAPSHGPGSGSAAKLSAAFEKTQKARTKGQRRRGGSGFRVSRGIQKKTGTFKNGKKNKSKGKAKS